MQKIFIRILNKYFFMTLLLLVTFNSHVYADASANSSNSQFYYDIGGASSISGPLNLSASSASVGASLEFGLGFSCGKFDLTLGISNILNSLKGLGNSIVNGAVGAVSAAIGNLPALILQRVNPGLYDLYQNGKIRAEAVLALANKSCEQYESDIRNGENPYSDWSDLSKSMDWKVQMGSGSYGSSSADVDEAKTTVETNNGKNGIPWLGGVRAGGEGQTAIKVTNDIVKAGYNLTLNRASDSSSSPSSSARLVDVWSSPGNASNWVVDVIGDSHIMTHDNSVPTTKPGHGLAPKIEQEYSSISVNMAKLVNNVTQPTIANVRAVSSEDTLINYDVIMAIRQLEPSERAIAVSKLSSEVAMSRTLEKALFARRMILTGLRDPNIAEATPAIQYGKDAVKVLNQEIENVLFEKRIRTELASKTASIILSLQSKSDKQGKIDMQATEQDSSLVEEGATN